MTGWIRDCCVFVFNRLRKANWIKPGKAGRMVVANHHKVEEGAEADTFLMINVAWSTTDRHFLLQDPPPILFESCLQHKHKPPMFYCEIAVIHVIFPATLKQ